LFILEFYNGEFVYKSNLERKISWLKTELYFLKGKKKKKEKKIKNLK
jgi:hypothetical protein